MNRQTINSERQKWQTLADYMAGEAEKHARATVILDRIAHRRDSRPHRRFWLWLKRLVGK